MRKGVCKECGKTFSVESGRGFVPHYCGAKCKRAANDRRIKKRNAQRDRTKVCVCIDCGAFFPVTHKVKRCWICRSGFSRSDSRRKARREICRSCGDLFVHREGHNKFFCCRECWLAWNAYEHEHKEMLIEYRKQRTDFAFALQRLVIGRLLFALKSRIQSLKSAVRLCVVCGDRLKHKGSYCSIKCYRKTQRYKDAKRIGKHRRRAREHNATFERISPADIFERDGWFCRECGRQTPKDKRGSYDDDAPELDHIIPISKGGAHTWNNLQCLCRSCNGLKSASMPNRRLLNRRKSEMKVDEAQKWLVF